MKGGTVCSWPRTNQTAALWWRRCWLFESAVMVFLILPFTRSLCLSCCSHSWALRCVLCFLASSLCAERRSECHALTDKSSHIKRSLQIKWKKRVNESWAVSVESRAPCASTFYQPDSDLWSSMGPTPSWILGKHLLKVNLRQQDAHMDKSVVTLQLKKDK